jgi:hypothetical protein
MGYRNKDDFANDYSAAAALAKTKYGAFYKEIDDDIAWKAYSNSAKKTDADNSVLGLMLFGRHLASMRTEVAKRAQEAFKARQDTIAQKDEKLKKKWYVPSAYREYKTKQRTQKNFAQLNRDKDTVPASIETDKDSAMMKNFGMVNNNDSGSILLMGSSSWNLTINDCWLLGAVHSNLPFYPASTVSRANIFDDKYVLSITGRELFGLALFGYRQVIPDYPELGSAFEVADPRKAAAADLVAYQKAMGDLTLPAAQKVFKDAGFRISEVGL